MINCKLFSHVYSATPPIPRICAYHMTRLVHLALWPKSGFKNKYRGWVRA